MKNFGAAKTKFGMKICLDKILRHYTFLKKVTQIYNLKNEK